MRPTRQLDGAIGSTASLARKDIWTLAKEAKESRDKKNPSAAAEDGYETTMVVVGNSQCGKSTLIHRLRNKDDAPTPTVALEYRFARSTRGTIKDVAHIWELAGGTQLAGLMDIPVSEANIHLITFVVVVDLSQPAEAISVLEFYMDRIAARVKTILDGLEQRGSKRPKGMKAFALKRFGQDHPDLSSDVMNILPVPLVVIGSMYDRFRDLEPERKKLVTKFLRYMAHTRGASLLFVSLKDENANAKARKLLNHHAFRSSPLVEFTFDHNKAVTITAGQDALAQIGPAPSEAGRDTMGKYNYSRYSTWRKDFDSIFPQRATGNEAINLEFEKYPEPTIDAMRTQKDEELQKLRRLGR
ncbi:hypothetical protein DFJ73DRAFT_960173 [Zopfochytrium polystomum]|nr:hypothetical protein DFJ73DRAFT_960173 [Zopfochytrium polystomum]